MSHGGDIYRNKVNMDFSVNLNPLGPQEEILNAVRNSIGMVSKYPDLEQEGLREILATALGLNRNYVFAGNGASELIMAVVRAVKPRKALLFEPVFSGYEYALKSLEYSDYENYEKNRSRILKYQLEEDNDFRLTEEDLHVINEDIDLIFLCDPVNPTGWNIDEDILIKILDKAKSNNTYVCIDESFFLMSDKALYDMDTGKANRAELVRRYDNLIIIRSLTKLLAMPGIRMGYVLSLPQNIQRIKKQLPEWNLSVTSEVAIREGMRVITETDFIQRVVAEIRCERSYLQNELKNLGFKIFDSDTSFLFFKGPENLYEKLLEENILIRDCSDFSGLQKGFYRIAVKSHRENVELIRVLRELTVNSFN